MDESRLSPLDWSLPVTSIPDGGRAVTREATEAERAALVDALDLVSCTRLRLDVTVRALARGRYLVQGRLDAAIAQPCIVTLDPVPAVIAESIDTEFWPPDQIKPADDAGEREILAGDDPEPIEAGRIALGRLAFEVLTAALDPYPRASDATLGDDGIEAAPRDATPSGPFAALAALRDREPNKP